MGPPASPVSGQLISPSPFNHVYHFPPFKIHQSILFCRYRMCGKYLLEPGALGHGPPSGMGPTSGSGPPRAGVLLGHGPHLRLGPSRAGVLLRQGPQCSAPCVPPISRALSVSHAQQGSGEGGPLFKKLLGSLIFTVSNGSVYMCYPLYLSDKRCCWFPSVA